MKIQMVCKKCGSTDVRRDADALWSVERQQWELVGLYDAAFCESCQDTTNLTEVEIPEGQI